MKKIILILALVAATATTAMAQSTIGASFLNNVATTTVSSSSSTTTSEGFQVGFDYIYGLDAKGFSVVPGVHYGYLTNSNATSIGGVAGLSGKVQEHYLSIPVNFKYTVSPSKSFDLFAFAGPQFNFGIISKTITTTTILGQSSTTTTDNYGDNSDYSRFDVAVGLGAGADISDMLRVSFSYNIGLLDRNSNDNITLKNNYWQVGAAFLF